MATFDRFDIVEAHFWHAVNYHGGMGSELYAKQCRISRYFSPGACQTGPSTENAWLIYCDLAGIGWDDVSEMTGEVLRMFLPHMGLTDEDAETIVGLASGDIDPETVFQSERFAGSQLEQIHRYRYDTTEAKMGLINALLDTHGVEAVWPETPDGYPMHDEEPIGTYCNTGDCYTMTIGQWDGEIRLCVVADFADMATAKGKELLGIC